MARASLSTKSQTGAEVFDFVPYLVRHRLGWRIGSRGILLARKSGEGVLTVVHRVQESSSGDAIDRRIAQLRPEGVDFQLFWKRGNGRWTAYYDERGERVIESLAGCIDEISRDPFGCYWT